MKTIPFSNARGCLTDIVNEAAYAGRRFILTRKGKGIAAIISLKDLKLLQSMELRESNARKKAASKKRKEKRAVLPVINQETSF